MKIVHQLFTASLAICLISGVAARADDPDIAEIDATLAAAHEAFGLAPGMAVAIVRRGQEPVILTYGSRGDGLPMTPETWVNIASLSKAFTGLAAEVLHQSGEIDLDQTLSESLAWSEIPANMIAPSSTLRDLLTHSHGLVNRGVEHRFLLSGLTSQRDVLAALGETGVNADAPAGSYNYSNFGYILFQLHLEHVFGTEWQSLVASRVVEPLGLTGIALYPDALHESGQPVSGRHVLAADGAPVPIDFLRRNAQDSASGTLFATSIGYAEWLAAWLERPEILPANAFDEATSVQLAGGPSNGGLSIAGYGMGWFVGDYHGHPVAYHAGGYAGGSAFAVLLPETEAAAFVFANEYPNSLGLARRVGAYLAGRLAGLEAEQIEMLGDLTPTVLAQDGVSSAQQWRSRFASAVAPSWRLSRPIGNYVGRYSHPAFGDIEVLANADGLGVRMGLAESDLYPVPATDRGFVLTLGSIPEPVRFIVDDSEVTALVYQDIRFDRVDP